MPIIIFYYYELSICNNRKNEIDRRLTFYCKFAYMQYYLYKKGCPKNSSHILLNIDKDQNLQEIVCTLVQYCK